VDERMSAVPSGLSMVVHRSSSLINEAFAAMTGYSSDEAVGRTPRMLQSPRTDGDELDRLRHALAAWEAVEASC
jgi:PAS domain S-box-containing protein